MHARRGLTTYYIKHNCNLNRQYKTHIFTVPMDICSWSQWPRGLRRRSAAARLLGSWVRIPPRAWMFVCCVLSGRGLCDELITRPEESYRLWCVDVCDLENLKNEEAMICVWSQRHSKKKKNLDRLRITQTILSFKSCLPDQRIHKQNREYFQFTRGAL